MSRSWGGHILLIAVGLYGHCLLWLYFYIYYCIRFHSSCRFLWLLFCCMVHSTSTIRKAILNKCVCAFSISTTDISYIYIYIYMCVCVRVFSSHPSLACGDVPNQGWEDYGRYGAIQSTTKQGGSERPWCSSRVSMWCTLEGTGKIKEPKWFCPIFCFFFASNPRPVWTGCCQKRSVQKCRQEQPCLDMMLAAWRRLRFHGC